MTSETVVLPSASDASRRETGAQAPGKLSVSLVSPLSGTLWFAGWLFTIGAAQLVWWKALLALILWPYFLGVLAR